MYVNVSHLFTCSKNREEILITKQGRNVINSLPACGDYAVEKSHDTYIGGEMDLILEPSKHIILNTFFPHRSV